MIPKGRHPSNTKLELLPHPKAPLFQRSDSDLLINHVLSELESGNFSTSNQEVRELIRQAGFVNLWFFLKFIAGYNGPYNDLTDHLHVDMCNFYQKVQSPGQRAAAYLPRGVFKSSIFTHGGNTWDILRNPDIVIGLGSAIIDRSQEFLQITQRTFDGNEFFAWLYPEYVEGLKEKGRITIDEFVVPNRSRFRVEPTIKIFAVGGSTQGIHCHKVKIDDPIGDAQLDSRREANADMERIRHWLKSNTWTLLIDPRKGIILIVGTVYHPEDAYSFIFEDIRSFTGFWDEDEGFQLKENGIWDVYYRDAEEYGKAIFPERLSLPVLEKIKEVDYWTYMTQYRNKRRKISISEFMDLSLKECWLDWEADKGVVKWVEGGVWKQEMLDAMDIVQAADPASTDSRKSAKTSRTAVVVYARSGSGNRFILNVRADYVKTSKMFEWLFDNKRMFPMMRSTVLETQGPYKLLTPLLREEQVKRGVPLGLRDVTASGDKDARIRTGIEGVLSKGLVYAVPSAKTLVEEELKSFPNSLKKDILDAFALAERGSVAPRTSLEIEEEEEQRELMLIGRNPYTGY
jgi:hypothetical protein